VQYGGCLIETDADAYLAEKYLGHILRYLKCPVSNPDPGGCNTGSPRYPNLWQVFLTTRTYGGYAKNPDPPASEPSAGCLSPEPYSYETAFAIQRAIRAQIDGTTTDYVGDVRYPSSAPWFDWGPYLWANPNQFSVNGLAWCNGESGNTCQSTRDFRYGDLTQGYTQFWGDFTHPSYQGQKKVADELLKFIRGGTSGITGPQHFISDWVTWALSE